MTTDRKEFFRRAWAVARLGASKFGGSPRAYFAEALRIGYAYLRSIAPVAAPAPIAADKVEALAEVVLGWPRKLRNTFTSRFVLDNADRIARFGERALFSAKQVEIINDLYSKYL